MTFEPTQDMALVKKIITHPKLWPYLSDDFSPPPEQFEPAQAEGIIYLLVSEENRTLGCFLLHSHSAIVWEVHTCLLPEAWGKSEEATKGGTEWVWSNLPCMRLITNVPNNNKLALRLAKRSGMQQFGCNPDSFAKAGKVYSMAMLGISRPGIESLRGESCQQQQL